MPIIIGNYNWKQNTEKIHISVPLKDVHVSNLHLFVSKKYVKLNSPPYLFELILYGTVQSNKSKCIIKEGQVILELTKEEPGLWAQLPEVIGQKKVLVDVKKEIIETGQQIASAEKKTKEKLKFEQTHFLRDCQMLLNNEERKTIELLKEEQKINAIRELATWKMEKNCERGKNRRSEELGNEVSLPVPIPFPRNNGIITFFFTPRVLPTPKRESKSAEEEEWLKKQAEAMRCSGFVAADLSDEEKDPVWLLNKGTKFFENSNYLGALNTFEYATRMSPKTPTLYVKLAETLLKLGHYPKAIDKATAALELLTPVVRQNQNMRAEAFRIRAEAYDSIGERQRSEADYKEFELALKSQL